MKKEEFKNALISEVQKIPLAERAKWDSTDLFVWWARVSQENTYLRWDNCKGDLWQRVPGFLKSYFGPKAVL